MTVANIHTTII